MEMVVRRLHRLLLAQPEPSGDFSKIKGPTKFAGGACFRKVTHTYFISSPQLTTSAPGGRPRICASMVKDLQFPR